MILKPFRNNFIFIGLIMSSMIFSSCSNYRTANFESYLLHSNCNQQNVYQYDSLDIPEPLTNIDLGGFLLNNFSLKSLNVAHAIDILPLLDEYGKLKSIYNQESNIQNQVNLIDSEQLIFQKINNASLEISALSSEMDCEEERTSQIANYLKNLESEKETKLTVASIVVGASGAILTGIYSADKSGTVIGITTGIAEAALGVMILINTRKIEFMHPRNALRDIWEGNYVSTNFPPSIWYYLSHHNPAKPDEKSLRYQIVEKWIDFGQISRMDTKKNKKTLDIYFNEGGKYSSQQLSNRADMYDQVESSINLMKQDLKSLSQEVTYLFELK